MSDKDWKKEALALVVLLRAKCSDEEWANMESRFEAAPAPQPERFGDWCDMKGIEPTMGQVDAFVREQVRAATPQVTPQTWPCTRCGKEHRQFEACFEGTSEQASPTPELCLGCGEECDIHKGTLVSVNGWYHESCAPKLFGGTQKSRDTGVSLDGGKTIHSKFKND